MVRETCLRLERYHIRRFLVILTAYFITGYVGLQLQYQGTNQSMVWLPPGIGLAMLIVWGWRYFPALFLGSILTTIPAGIPVVAAILIGITSCLSITVPAVILGRYFRSNLLSQFRGLLALLLIGVVAMPSFSALLGTGMAYLNGLPEATDFLALWLSWALSGMVGVLVTTPLIVRICEYQWNAKGIPHYLELAFIAGSATIVSATVNSSAMTSRPEYLFIFASLPFLIWSAIRFGLLGATLVNALITITIVIFSAMGTGSFIQTNASNSILDIHAYVLCVSFVAILLGFGAEKLGRITQHAKDGQVSSNIQQIRMNLAVIVTVVGFSISTIAAVYTYSQLVAADRNVAEQYRLAFEASLREELSSATDSLIAVGTLFDVHGSISASTFDAMIAPWVNRRPGVAALEWAPHVERRARGLIEENAALRGVDNFAIREYGDGAPRVSPEKDVYYPVFFVFPRSGNEKAIGLDLRSEAARRRALETSLRTGSITLTEPLTLVQSTTPVTTALAFLAVENRRDRTGPPLGVAIGVLRLTDMIRRAARIARIPADFDIHLADMAANGEQKLIFSNRQPETALGDIQSQIEIPFNSNVSNFTYGYRDWTIVIHPPQDGFASLLYWQPWAIFVFGSTISILLLIYLRSLNRTEKNIVDLVAMRTRELEDARAEAEKAMKQAQQADRAKTEFVAHMSHEFRSPMTSILGYTQLASDSLDKDLSAETLRNYLKTIRDAGRHVLSLIGDVLDISKIEAGKLTLEEAPLDLHRLCEEVVSMMLIPARDQGNTLVINIAPNLPRYVVGDPVRLKQIVTNLVSNAIKFTKNGTITISAQPLNSDDDELSFRISVRDEGIGIPSAKLKSIFEAFSQVDTTISRKYGGTGLGLAICQRMIQAMGGTIQVDSQEGKGSQFWFDLALPRSSQEKFAEFEEQNSIPTPSLTQDGEPAETGKWNLLLVEDIQINRILAQKLLEQCGHTITTAADGQMALDLLAGGDFDGVLMDLHMPVLDGMAATQKIRAFEDPVKATIPVLALTADISNDNLEKFRETGFDAYCTKPLDIDKINAELARLAHRKLETRQVRHERTAW